MCTGVPSLLSSCVPKLSHVTLNFFYCLAINLCSKLLTSVIFTCSFTDPNIKCIDLKICSFFLIKNKLRQYKWKLRHNFLRFWRLITCFWTYPVLIYVSGNMSFQDLLGDCRILLFAEYLILQLSQAQPLGNLEAFLSLCLSGGSVLRRVC